MGIPVPQSSRVQAKVSQVELQTIVANVSQATILYRDIPSNIESLLKRKQVNPRLMLEDVKLLPRIPKCDYAIEEEQENLRADKFPLFTKAQPRGRNGRNLRTDKSPLRMEFELNATRAKFETVLEYGKSSSSCIPDTVARIQSKGKFDESETKLKKSYNGIIAAKLQAFKQLASGLSEVPLKALVENEQIDDDIQSTVAACSSLSSEGTYFTNDSGSFLLEMDQKIPKREMNLKKNFRVS